MAVTILGSDFPICEHPDCKMLAQDGYCLAECCNDGPHAYCAQHSHRPAMLLEMLGHSSKQDVYNAGEVRNIILAMWKGAGNIFEAQGYLMMMKEIAFKRMEKIKESAVVEADRLSKQVEQAP